MKNDNVYVTQEEKSQEVKRNSKTVNYMGHDFRFTRTSDSSFLRLLFLKK